MTPIIYDKKDIRASLSWTIVNNIKIIIIKVKHD